MAQAAAEAPVVAVVQAAVAVPEVPVAPEEPADSIPAGSTPEAEVAVAEEEAGSMPRPTSAGRTVEASGS